MSVMRDTDCCIWWLNQWLIASFKSLCRQSGETSWLMTYSFWSLSDDILCALQLISHLTISTVWNKNNGHGPGQSINSIAMRHWLDQITGGLPITDERKREKERAVLDEQSSTDFLFTTIKDFEYHLLLKKWFHLIFHSPSVNCWYDHLLMIQTNQ